MRTAPSRQESRLGGGTALDADELHRAAAEVEHRAVAQRRRVDRRQVARARLLVAREHADLEPDARAHALEEVLASSPPRGSRSSRRRRSRRSRGPQAAQKWAKTSIARDARAIAVLAERAGLVLAGADAHRLVDLVGALPPAGEPSGSRVDAEDDEPERVRAEVGDREPRELGADVGRPGCAAAVDASASRSMSSIR